MAERNIANDFLLAVMLTLTGAFLAWLLTKGLPTIGIDDAAITRSYAENVANGVGYVYNIGGERVEGSTAFLWVGILSVLYAISDTPELLIIGLCAVLSVLSVFATLRLTRWLAHWLGASQPVAIGLVAVFLIAAPGYFLWSVWTMMELAIWSTMLLWLVLLLSKAVEQMPEAPEVVGIVLAGLLMPLIRPEGIAVALGLIVLAVILSPGIWRTGLAACVAALVSFVAVTVFRLSYFGQPFPNTFYAKVSSDKLQGLKDGLKYLFDFLLNAPYAELFVALWFAAAIWALGGLRGGAPGRRALLIGAAAVFGMLSVYAGLGGDHFVLWRFYQPVYPLLPVALAVMAARAIMALERNEDFAIAGWMRIGALAGSFAIALMAWMHYYQSRFDITKEFRLVEQGVGFGDYLNQAQPLPSIGVGPAGGIALAYDGEILDLLGLNWTEMAHANPVKVGMRNHASFDKPTFWKHAPDILSAFNRPCGEGDNLVFWSKDDAAFDGLFSDPEFQAAYLPVVFRENGQCWPGFARPEWLDTAQIDGMTTLRWSDVNLLN